MCYKTLRVGASLQTRVSTNSAISERYATSIPFITISNPTRKARAESRFTIWDLLSTLSHCHHQRTLLQNFKTTNNHAHSLCAQTNLIGEPYTDVLVFLSFSLQKQEDEEEYSEGLEVFTEQMNIMGAYRTPLGPTGRL